MDLVRLAKKHSSLLLPIGIALVAILLFVPALLAGRALRSQMQESVSMGNQIGSLVRNTVPTTQYKAEQAYQREHADDANAVIALAQQTSERELLVYGMFPEPNETSSAIFLNFGKVYRKAIEDFVGSLRAQDCPTDAEITEVTRSGAADAAGRYGQDSAASGRNEAIIERLCKDRSQSIPIYASPVIFSGYNFWDNYNYVGRDEAIEDCWKTQIAYWIQKDVVDTIAAMNKDSSSVSKSPIKRLVSIGFSVASTGYTTGRSDSYGMADMPRYVLSATDGILTIPWTGRISNDDIDVVHFAFSAIVSSKDVGRFMKELCSQKTHVFKGWSGQEQPQQFVHNQITILKSTAEPVSRPTTTGATAMGVTADKYRYGDDATVQLSLVCEYVFDKTGYAKVKPKTIAEKQASTEASGTAPAPSSTSPSSNRRSTRGGPGIPPQPAAGGNEP